MVTEAKSRARTPIGRRLAQSDVQELLKSLSPVDLQLLQWLLRYPFQRAEDLAIAMGTSIATVYRHLGMLENLGLIERVLPAILDTGACSLYYLSNVGLHVIALHEGKDPTALAQFWRSDERGLLRLLPRLARLVTVQDCINGLVLHAPEALAHLGRRSEVRWHLQRDVAQRFIYRDKVTRYAADAGLVLRIQPMADGDTRVQERWYSLFLLMDSGIADTRLLRQRLSRFLLYRECAERWPVYQHFPLVLILTSTDHRMEHWQRCAEVAATALQLAPLVGAIASLPVANDTGTPNLWRCAWKSLATNGVCRLRDVLNALPLDAIPSGLRGHQTSEDATPSATWEGDVVYSTPRKLARIISGNFTARAEYMRKQGYVCDCREEREAIALLGLILSRRHLNLLDMLCDYPFLHMREMAALTDLQVSSVERYLRELRHAGCIDPVSTCVGPRYRLNERGLRLAAAAHHISIQSLATSSTAETNEDEASLVQRGQDVLLRHVEHTAGIYSFFAALAQAARQEPEHRLLWWETGASCERRYRDHDHWHNLRPDAVGEYLAGERRVCFWLEWDRATMGTRDLVAKFTTYAHYVTSREWFREKFVLPLLLIVAPGKDQEMRIARVVTQVLANVPGLVVHTTTATRLTEGGALAAIWYQVLPNAEENETLVRRRFNDVSR